MQARTLIVTALIGGPLAGVFMGLAASPEMTRAREPSWRQSRPDAVPDGAMAETARLVDTGPQDLSPTWYLDRMPTWKRRAMADRQAEMRTAAYMPDTEIYGETIEPPQVVGMVAAPDASAAAGASTVAYEARQATASPEAAISASDGGDVEPADGPVIVPAGA
jgi:hypothetical protein